MRTRTLSFPLVGVDTLVVQMTRYSTRPDGHLDEYMEGRGWITYFSVGLTKRTS